MAFTKIEMTTPVHDFPGIYNDNITELERKIAELEEAIAAKDALITQLRSECHSAIEDLRAKYLEDFDKLRTDIEETYQKK